MFGFQNSNTQARAQAQSRAINLAPPPLVIAVAARRADVTARLQRPAGRGDFREGRGWTVGYCGVPGAGGPRRAAPRHPGLVSNLRQSSCLSLPGDGIASTPHHAHTAGFYAHRRLCFHCLQTEPVVRQEGHACRTVYWLLSVVRLFEVQLHSDSKQKEWE